MPDRKDDIVWRKYFYLEKIVIWISESSSQHSMARKSSRNKAQRGKNCNACLISSPDELSCGENWNQYNDQSEAQTLNTDCKKFHWLHKGVSAKVADAAFSHLGGGPWAWQCNAREQYK